MADANTAEQMMEMDTGPTYADQAYMPSPHAPVLHNPADISDNLRVASTTPNSAAAMFINTPPSIQTSTGKELPIASIIVTSQQRKPDLERLLRWTPYIELRTKVIAVPFVTPQSSNQKASRRLRDFTQRYAAAVQSGKVPVLVIKKPSYGERITFDNDPHAQAFFAGMVASALNPQGVVLAVNDSRTRDSREEMEFRDSLALAASQGRHALVNRHIAMDGPQWSHIGTQMARLDRQLRGFHEKHQASQRPEQYLWTERDPRSHRGDPRFAPHHVTMFQSAISGSYSTPAWLKRMIQYVRPTAEYDTDPSRQMDVFRRYLANHGPAMAAGGAVVFGPVHPADRAADAAKETAPAVASARRFG